MNEVGATPRAAPDRRANEPGFYLFVYGTLRSGGEANERIAGCTFVRNAYVEGTLYDIEGHYPALMLYGGTRVQGEIWRCAADSLAAIDAYEGVDRRLFRRVAVDVDGTPCWAYVAGPALAHLLTPGQRIESGLWPARGGG
jgi:gamma-glutamylcyclotransferase (GGCT)/AIG2-like uncharacterized protein YtfP